MTLGGVNEAEQISEHQIIATLKAVEAVEAGGQ